MDRIVSSEDPKYWRIIRDKALFLEHMIEDLFELTKLETKQIHFHFQEEEIIPFMQYLYQKYELAIRSNDIDVRFHLLKQGHSDSNRKESIAKVTIDPIRIEQIFSNLTNAQKFTPSGGQITICVIIDRKNERGNNYYKSYRYRQRDS